MEGLDLSKFSDEQLEALSKGDYSTLTEEQLKHLSDVHEANRKPEERRAEERYVENPVNPLVTGAVGAATGPAVGYMTEKYKQGVAEHRIAPKGSVTVEAAPSSIVPSAAQHEQIITGGTDASGTTGRARQQGYNENTALQARNAEIAEQNAARVRAMGLRGTAQDPFAAVGTRVTSTPTGIIAPASTVYNPPAAGAPASIMERLSQAYPEIRAGLSKVASSGAMPYIGRAVTGAGTGLSLADTINRLKAHDYLGAGLSAIQTGAAGATMFQPELAPFTIPIGLGAAGAQYLYDNPEVINKLTPENAPMMAAGGQIAIKKGGLVHLAEGGEPLNQYQVWDEVKMQPVSKIYGSMRGAQKAAEVTGGSIKNMNTWQPTYDYSKVMGNTGGAPDTANYRRPFENTAQQNIRSLVNGVYPEQLTSQEKFAESIKARLNARGPTGGGVSGGGGADMEMMHGLMVPNPKPTY